jgi:hypothetical protein
MNTAMNLVMAMVFGMCLCVPVARADAVTVRTLADQGVLVHRITKSVCLLLVGAETPVHAQDVEDSSEQLVQLATFDTTDHLMADIDTLVKSARQIAAGDRHSVPVNLLLRTNPVLADAFGQMADAAGAAVQPAHRGSYVRVQELRVTSQAFQRDLCLFLTGLSPDGAGELMAERVTFFAQSLDHLVTGLPADGLVAAPNIHIKITLGKVAGQWKTLEPILRAAAAGAPIDSSDAKIASVLGDAILKNFDEITDRFLALAL